MNLVPIPLAEGRFQDYCTPREAAEIKGVAAPSVYDAIKAGRIQPYSIYGQTILLRADVEKLKVRRKKDKE